MYIFHHIPMCQLWVAKIGYRDVFLFVASGTSSG
jgi:hypothetical protein